MDCKHRRGLALIICPKSPYEKYGFEDFLGYVRENGLDKELNISAIRADMRCMNDTDYTTLSKQADYFAA